MKALLADLGIHVRSIPALLHSFTMKTLQTFALSTQTSGIIMSERYVSSYRGIFHIHKKPRDKADTFLFSDDEDRPYIGQALAVSYPLDCIHESDKLAPRFQLFVLGIRSTC